MCVMFSAHSISSLFSTFNSVVCYLWLMCMLIYVGINAESTPSISGYEEISKPSFAFNLVNKPYFEVTPFYFWLIFHHFSPPIINIKIITNRSHKATPPQRGKVTNHQLQSITCVSLRTRNTRKSRLQKLMPPPVAAELLLLII